MVSTERGERIAGAALLGVPAFDFFVWALDTYGRGDLLMNLSGHLPSFLLNPGVGFVCMAAGFGLLYMAERNYFRSLQKSGSRILDSQGQEYVNGPTPRWLVPVGVVFLLALVAAPVLAVTYSLSYRGTPPESPKVVPPPFAYLTTEQMRPSLHYQVATRISQQGENNIAQVGDSNRATINAAPPSRVIPADKESDFTDALRAFPGGEIAFIKAGSSDDVAPLENQLFRLAGEAGWRRVFRGDTVGAGGETPLVDGLECYFGGGWNTPMGNAFQQAFAAVHLKCSYFNSDYTFQTMTLSAPTVVIGRNTGS
jgi:hypothetical protein